MTVITTTKLIVSCIWVKGPSAANYVNSYFARKVLSVRGKHLFHNSNIIANEYWMQVHLHSLSSRIDCELWLSLSGLLSQDHLSWSLFPCVHITHIPKKIEIFATHQCCDCKNTLIWSFKTWIGLVIMKGKTPLCLLFNFQFNFIVSMTQLPSSRSRSASSLSCAEPAWLIFNG